MSPPIDRCARPFLFERDTFTFANELVWEYQLEPGTSRMITFWKPHPPAYTHRCFVLVRSARQFFYHARFDPDLPVAGPEQYGNLVRQIVSRSPRRRSSEAEKLVIPGYDCLRSFSRAQEQLLKARLGGAWQSYCLRSHWRMVFPTSRKHQAGVVRQLQTAFVKRSAPIVHLYRFPRVTINHGVVLFGARASEKGCTFDVYDPNLPDRPLKLFYDASVRTFLFPPTPYWAGGPLNVLEIYTGGLY